MAGDSILIRRKDVIAGKGIAIEPSGVSAAIRIINTEVDSERLLPVNPTVNDIPIYKQMDAEGNGEDVKLLIQSPATASQVADTAAGVVTHATVTAHGSLGVDDRGLLFDGNTYLEIDKNNVQSILTGSNPWCFDLYITGSEEVTSSYVQIGSLFTDNNDYVINWGMIDGKVNAVNIPAWGTIEGFTAGEPHLLTIEHYISAGASTIALYCDNVRRSVISNVILPTVNENLWIGKGPVGYFKGWLDYIRIRNTAPYQSSTITPDPTPYLAAGERWTVINLSEIEGGGGATPTDVDWNDIQNKPSTFPPSAHTHIISDVTGLSDVAVKAHTHENKITLDKFGEVNNKPTFNGEEIGSGVSSWNDLEDKPTTFPPSEHTHQIADVSGLQDSLDSKVSSVNGQTGTVTIPNASATEAGLMSAADKSKLDGIDTTGSTGDMLKSVYDTNNDGIVDHAAVADAIGTATATQVETAVSQSHTHENKTTLDKLGETDGALTYDGVAVGGGGSGASSLADLSDTANIAEATDNQVLTYNATSGKWEPADAASIDARDSIQFTASDLTEGNKLVVSNTTVGSLAILDENLKQVQPDLQQVAGNVEVDFTGWTISGTWTVVFVQGSGSGTGGATGSVSWTDLIGKPSTFPPSAHTQDQSTINGLTDALATKLTTPAGGTTGQVLTKTADSVTWSNAAGDMLKSEYDADDDGTVDNANLALFAQNVGTSPENSKSYSQVSSAVELMHEHSNMSVLNGIGVSSNQLTYNGSAVGGTPSWNNVTDKPDSFTPSAHTHAIADVTGLSDALETSLLPENPSTNDIPCYNADAKTYAVFHFDDSVNDSLIENTGVTLDTTNSKFGAASAKFIEGSYLDILVSNAQLTNQPWVIDCWFRLSAADNTTMTLFSDFHNYSYFVARNRVGFSAGTDTPTRTLAIDLTTGWHYARVVNIGSLLDVFIDGTRFVQNIKYNLVYTDSTKLRIGKSIADTTQFIGNIDEVRIQYLGKEEVSNWIGSTIQVPTAPAETVDGKWLMINKSSLVQQINGLKPNAVGSITIPTVTTSAAGLMSASDKTKLDGLSGTAGTVTSVNGIEPDSAGAVTLYTRTVASNEDVGSVDTPGTYYVDAGAGGLPSNDTAGGAYMMTVIRTESDGLVVQILNALYNPNVQYMRSRPGSSASWRAWSSPLDAIQGYTDLTTNYMSCWAWGGVSNGTPPGASSSDQMLIARLNVVNGTYNIQLAFDYTNGTIYMRRYTADKWMSMGVNGMYTMGGSVDMAANAAESENITKTLQIISISSVVATIDFAGSTVNWNELTSAPVVYVSHNTFAHNAGSSTGTLTLRFRVINPPAKAYKINWMLTGTFKE